MNTASLDDDGVAWLTHGHSRLALHQLREGTGRSLLLLHGLGEHARVGGFPHIDLWDGPVWGLDFTGHGRSSLTRGGGYTAEMMLGDADAALEFLGEATILGRGLGGYVAMMLAGARGPLVHGAIICDGPGLTGGGSEPGGPFVAVPTFGLGCTPDPYAMVELARDIRPADYALNFVRFAFDAAEVADPVVVSATVRPEWLAAVAAEQGVIEATVADALAMFASPMT